jgi:hypothetical protein
LVRNVREGRFGEVAFEVFGLLVLFVYPMVKVFHRIVDGFQLVFEDQGGSVKFDFLRGLDEQVVVLSVSNKIHAEGTVVFDIEPLRDALGAKGMDAFLELHGVLLSSKTN